MTHHARPEHPEDVPQPIIPMNRGVHAQEGRVDFEPGEDACVIVIWLDNADKIEFKVEASDQSITVVSDETTPPLRQALEMPRCIQTDTLQIEKCPDRIRLCVQYQEERCHPKAISPGGAYEEPFDHPRSEKKGHG